MQNCKGQAMVVGDIVWARGTSNKYCSVTVSSIDNCSCIFPISHHWLVCRFFLIFNSPIAYRSSNTDVRFIHCLLQESLLRNFGQPGLSLILVPASGRGKRKQGSLCLLSKCYLFTAFLCFSLSASIAFWNGLFLLTCHNHSRI